LIGLYPAIAILKVKAGRLTWAPIRTMRSLATSPFKAKQLGDSACILEANIFRIVSQPIDELISL
jgi:hypothetical protein